MRKSIAIICGQVVGWFCRFFNLGAGVTWAGEIGLRIDPDLIKKLVFQGAKVILVAGTNGKTTTAKLLASILPGAVSNKSGANLLNGIAGTLINSPPSKCYIFEIDENNLLPLLKQIHADAVILLNLFRDQLDRYGEVDKIAKDWLDLTNWSNLIINADDPQLAWVGEKYKGKVSYFGLGDRNLFLPQMPHATDSIFCPNCEARLEFSGVYLSHLGEYRCESCGFAHPKNEKTIRNVKAIGGLEGVYNYYNLLAVGLTAKVLGIKNPKFANFRPAFGRSEEIGKTKILLSKNPAGFNESLRTVLNSPRKGPLYLALNDRVPDGRDVSWIWDVDFEVLRKYPYPIFVGGDRALDLALRLKYAEVLCKIEEKLDAAWILPTYSAMLDIRKKLTGRKIL